MGETLEAQSVSGLADASRDRAFEVGTVEEFPPGAVLCRRGELGSRFYIVLSGGVVAYPKGEDRSDAFYLGTNEIIGELSLITGVPISATVVCDRPTRCLVLSKQAFLTLLQDDPAFQKYILDTLCYRVVAQTRKAWDHARPRVAILALPDIDRGYRPLMMALQRLVQQLSPGSQLLVHAEEVDDSLQLHDTVTRRVMPHLPQWLVRYEPTKDLYFTDELPELLKGLQAWTADGPRGATLLVACRDDVAAKLGGELSRSDCAVAVNGALGGGALERAFSAVHHARLEVGPDRRPASSEWSYRIPDLESPAATARLGALARWITWKEIGLVLGSGSARGFAHLGVLAELEQAGVPIDYIVGTSMGGIVAAVYAKHQDAAATIAEVRDALGSRRAIFDRALLPTFSFFRGRRVMRSAEQVFGELTFAELDLPCAVLATDLLRQQDVVIDAGPVAPAVLATSALPTIFPPVVIGGHVLLDGALARRVPVNLLDRRRCGFRIAVNVVPPPRARRRVGMDAEPPPTLSELRRPFGFRRILVHTWEFMCNWYAHQDLLEADVILEPDLLAWSPSDFDAFDHFVAAGRACAHAQIDMIRERADAMAQGR